MPLFSRHYIRLLCCRRAILLPPLYFSPLLHLYDMPLFDAATRRYYAITLRYFADIASCRHVMLTPPLIRFFCRCFTPPFTIITLSLRTYAAAYAMRAPC